MGGILHVYKVLMIGVDIVENVLERLGTTESTTLAVKRKDGGKIRVTSLLWAEPKVILKGKVGWKSAMSTVARDVALRAILSVSTSRSPA